MWYYENQYNTKALCDKISKSTVLDPFTLILTGTTIYIGQIYRGDFTKFCDLLRIYELYDRPPTIIDFEQLLTFYTLPTLCSVDQAWTFYLFLST